MNKNVVIAALALASVCPLTAMANTSSPSATLTMTSSVEVPSCELEVGNEGKAVLGGIRVEDLSADKVNLLGTASVDLNVRCGTKSMIALYLTDGNPNTAPPRLGTTIASGATDSDVFGFGVTSKGNIGGFLIEFTDMMQDTSRAVALRAPSDTGAWRVSSLARPNYYTTFGTSGGLGRMREATVTSGKMTIRAGIEASQNIAWSELEELKGRATLTLYNL